MVVDVYENTMGGLESPAREAAIVAPSDAVDLGQSSRSIYVGVSGDVAVHMIGESTPVVFRSVPVGVLPIRVDRVLASGTTATDIIALW